MSAKVVIIFGIVIAAIGGVVISYGFQLRDTELRAMKGELIPFEIDPQKPIEIQVGGIHVITTVNELSKGFNLSRYVSFEGFDYPFKIELQDGKFLVSVEIRNPEGEMIAKIVRNQWVVNTNTIIARDRNYNAYAFEVISADLVPVIQVVFTPENKMSLGGLFYGPTSMMLVTPNITIFNPSSDNIKENIQPIFLYPSEEHLGAMVNQPAPIIESTRVILGGVALGISGALLSSGLLVHEKQKKKKRRERWTQRNKRHKKRHAEYQRSV